MVPRLSGAAWARGWGVVEQGSCHLHPVHHPHLHCISNAQAHDQQVLRDEVGALGWVLEDGSCAWALHEVAEGTHLGESLAHDRALQA